MIINPYANPKQRSQQAIQNALVQSPLGEDFASTDNDITRYLALELAMVWLDFNKRLSKIPVVQKIEDQTLTMDDYKILLINMRQQVAEGGRWISRAASSMESDELFTFRSMMIEHAFDEHRDYQMLEKMYVSLGGTLKDIKERPRNIGSEALTSFMFHQTSKPNPLHLFGAMFIIEGLGSCKAGEWGRAIQNALNLEDKDIIFMLYHDEHDGDDHYQKLRLALSLPFITQEVAVDIVKTAKVVARLYCMQLEELDNY